MAVYRFRNEEFLALKGAKDADAQVIGEALATIADKCGGELRPADVVDAARAPGHVLNRHFEWDDAAAAERFREDQARVLIRSVALVRDDVPAPIAAFQSLSGTGGRSYRPIDVVLRSADLRVQALENAKRDLEGFRKRYRDLVDVLEVLQRADEVIDNRLAAERAA